MGAHVLLVDDNEDFLDSTRDILEIAGYRVTTAVSGAESLRLVRECRFDMALMDVLMPGMDGVECLTEMSKVRPELPIIMITAYGREDLKERACAGGAVEVLPKPIDISGLLITMQRLLRNRAKIRGSVMVVDDDRDFADNLAEVLTQAGYEAEVARNGESAFQKAQAGSFDLILLDMRLPVLDGLQVFRRLRPLQPQAVFLLVTGYLAQMNDSIEQALDEDACCCLQKPLDMDRLMELLDQLCSDLRTNKLPNTQSEEP